MKRAAIYLRPSLLTMVVCLFASCGERSKKIEAVSILSDISFQPIIQEQLTVFQSSFKQKQLTNVMYAPETVCFDSFLHDSIKMIITSRALKENEKAYLKEQKIMVSPSIRIAYDAIAVILPPSKKDTLFKQQDIRNILLDSHQSNLILVAMEGKAASSTLFTLIDQLDIPITQLNKRIIGLQNAQEVIRFVKQRSNAIGFVGISAISKMDKTQQYSFANSGIKVASILDKIEEKHFVKPYLSNIKNGYYPFIREMYYTVKEVESGPGLRFGRFMSNERGQLIFRRSHILPARMDFSVRDAKIRKN